MPPITSGSSAPRARPSSWTSCSTSRRISRCAPLHARPLPPSRFHARRRTHPACDSPVPPPRSASLDNGSRTGSISAATDLALASLCVHPASSETVGVESHGSCRRGSPSGHAPVGARSRRLLLQQRVGAWEVQRHASPCPGAGRTVLASARHCAQLQSLARSSPNRVAACHARRGACRNVTMLAASSSRPRISSSGNRYGKYPADINPASPSRAWAILTHNGIADLRATRSAPHTPGVMQLHAVAQRPITRCVNCFQRGKDIVLPFQPGTTDVPKCEDLKKLSTFSTSQSHRQCVTRPSCAALPVETCGITRPV